MSKLNLESVSNYYKTYLKYQLKVNLSIFLNIHLKMSEEELINLSWNKFQQATFHAFKNLQDDTHFTDVTLVGEDGFQIKAHKVILSASSSLFKNILVTNPHQHPLLYLKGVNQESLSNLLKFIYNGEVQIQDENLATFLVAANDLQIEGLAKVGTDSVSEYVVNNDQTKVMNRNIHKNETAETVDFAPVEILHKIDDTIDIADQETPEILVIENEHIDESNMEMDDKDKVATINEASNESDDNDYEIIDEMDEIIALSNKEKSKVFNQVESEQKNISDDRLCDICKKEFTNKYIAAEHKQAVHEGLKYLCDYCDLIASSRRSLRGHIERKHPHQSLPIIYTSVNAKDLNFEKIPQKFEFEESNENFGEQDREIHAFTCRYCNFKSKFNSNLKRHEKSHTTPATIDALPEDDTVYNIKIQVDDDKVKTGQFKCATCGKVLGTKASLKVHTAATHEGKKWPCDQCDHKASHISNLVRHQRTMHGLQYVTPNLAIE